jgi:protein-arginine kinase activator protein McsA
VTVFREARTVEGRPICETCNQQMWLLKIKPADNGKELRTFECSKCAGNMTILVMRESSSAG